jgi:transcriptional regulator with XRE-family HTH domain
MPGDIDPRAVTIAFGRRLREVREREGLSQDALGLRAKLHRSIIGRLERGAHQPTLSTALAVAFGLGVRPGELLDDLPVKPYGLQSRNVNGPTLSSRPPAGESGADQP